MSRLAAVSDACCDLTWPSSVGDQIRPDCAHGGNRQNPICQSDLVKAEAEEIHEITTEIAAAFTGYGVHYVNELATSPRDSFESMGTRVEGVLDWASKATNELMKLKRKLVVDTREA